MKKHFMFATLLATTTFAFASDAPATDPVVEGGHAVCQEMGLSDVVRYLSGDPDRDVTEEGTKALLLSLLAERDELQVSGSVLALKLAQQAADFHDALARKEQEHFDVIEALMEKHANDNAALQGRISLLQLRLGGVKSAQVNGVAARSDGSRFRFSKPGDWMKK